MTCRYRPGCVCAKAREEEYDFEKKVMLVSVEATFAALTSLRKFDLCEESERYVALTVATTMVASLAAVDGQGPESITEEKVDEVLGTIVEDIRLRFREMEAMSEKYKLTGGTH